MEIQRPGRAGTMESNDIYIMVQPGSGVEVKLESMVLKQFGRQIEKVIRETVKALGVTNILVTAKDRGALDYTIEARVEAAVKRAIQGVE